MVTVFELIAGWLTGSKDPHWLIVARKRPSSVLRHLRKQPGGLNHRMARGDTALIVATLHGRADLVKALLKQGADPSLANTDGDTALHTAAFFGRIDELDLLLETGISVSRMNNNLKTPQDLAGMPWTAELEDLIGNLNQVFALGLDLEEVRARRVLIFESLKAQAAMQAPPRQDPDQI